jgi:hypothetical protein
MWSLVTGFVLGALTTTGGLIYLLFLWNPRPMLQEHMAKRRAQKVAIRMNNREPNAWERAQRRTLLRPAPNFPPESTQWLNSLLAYGMFHAAEQVNRMAEHGRLEAIINEKLNKKQPPPFIVSQAKQNEE